MNADDVALFAPEADEDLDLAQEIRVDVLVLTALKDELDGLLGLRQTWTKAQDARGFLYHRCTLSSGLRVAAAWIGEMGQTAAMSRGKDLVRELSPECLAMCGICAGDPEQVALGDLIVADRLWAYDEGKQVENKFYHSMNLFRVERTWGMNAAYAKDWLDVKDLAAGRPPSREIQTRWLLHALYAHQFDGDAAPMEHPERKTRCPAFADIVKTALAENLVARAGRSMKLTDAGKDRVDEDALLHPDGVPSEKPHAIHIGAMATGSSVIKDGTIWERLRVPARETMAIDMEGAAIAQLADDEGKRFLVVKAVQDFANAQKDDTYRKFGCAASAKFVLAFLEKHLEPRPEAEVSRQAHFDVHEREFSRERENPLVRRVEQAAALRHPKAKIQRHRIAHPFAGLWELEMGDGVISEIQLVVALDAPITMDLVVRFATGEEKPFRLRFPLLRSTIVHQGERAPESLRIEAFRKGITLETFHAYQGLFDMKPYLEWQTNRLLQAEQYPSHLYVDAPAKLQVQGNLDWAKVDNALRHLWDLLDAPGHKRFALIIGDFGAGKTFLLRELARRMHQENHPVWPVLLEMRWLEKRHQLSELLGAHFSKADVIGYNFRAFQYMLNEGRIALLFDGFDELADRVTYDTVTDHFDTVLSAAHGEQAKVILSSRRQHFLSESQVMVGLAEKAQRMSGFRLLLLEEFQEAQIRRYLLNALGDGQAAAERYRLIDEVKDLLGLSHNPRMLGFIAQIPEHELRQAKAQKQGELTSADLYRVLIKNWLDYEYERLKGFVTAKKSITRETLDKGVRTLALAMWQNKQKTCQLEDIRRELSQVIVAPDDAMIEPDWLTHLFGSGSLLVRDRLDETEGCFSFVHRSVLEWLVARMAADQLSNDQEPVCLAADEMTPLMADFFCHSVDERKKVVAWARGKVSEHDDGTVQKNATLVLQRLNESQHDVVLAGQDLRGKDFTGVDWRRADLRGANLEGATLSGADLSGANLEGARLYRANLTNAKLVGAKLAKADLRITRLLKADLTGAQGLESAVLFRTNFAGARVPEGFDPVHGDPYGVGIVLRQTVPVWAGVSARCNSVAWHHASELLAAGFVDGTVRIFDALSGELLRVLTRHTTSVHCIAFSPDGTMLASGSSDTTLRLWDTSSGRELRALKGHEDWVLSVAFSPDGKTLASGSSDNTLRLWDRASGRTLRTLEGHAYSVRSVAFSPDGNTIASGSHDSTVRLWDQASGRALRTLQGHANSVSSVAFSPNGNTIGSGSWDNTVRLWDQASGRTQRTLQGHSNSVRSFAFSPNGSTIASGSDDNTVRLWDQASGRTLRTLQAHSRLVRSVAFSPDGNTVASASDDNAVHLWDQASGRKQRTLQGHSHWVGSVAFSPDGKTIASGSPDETVRLWDAASGRKRRTLQGHSDSVLSVAFSPDGNTVASGSADNTVRLWDASSGRERRLQKSHSDSVLSVAFSPDGTTIASGSEGGIIRLWDASSGRERRSLRGHSHAARSVAFSPDGNTIASGSADRTVRLWDASSGRQRRSLQHHSDWVRSVAFSPDGNTVASGSDDKTVRLWDVPSGREIRALIGHEYSVLCVAFRPDRGVIASCSQDKTVRLWDIASGKCLQVLEGHSADVRSVAFSPDGQTIASGSEDGTIRLWNVTSGQCYAILFATEDGWVAFSPDGRYKYGGNIRGSFWHIAGLCRFELGELPELQLPDDADFRMLAPMPPG